MEHHHDGTESVDIVVTGAEISGIGVAKYLTDEFPGKEFLLLGGKQVDTSNPFNLMFRSKMRWRDRLGLAAVGSRILANVPFLEMNPENRWPKRVRAKLDARSADFLLRGVTSELAREMVRS